MGMKRKKKKNKSGGKLGNLDKKITDILRKDAGKAYNYKQIAAKLGVDDPSSRNQITKKLAQLAAKKEINQVDRGKFMVEKGANYHTGILDMSTKGYGFVIVDEFEDDIMIPQQNLNAAFHGDEVEIYVYKHRRRKKSEGEITKIIKRKRSSFVGVLQLKKDFGFVVIDDPKMYTDFFVQKNKLGEAQDGDKVLVEFDDWPKRADSPSELLRGS